MSKKNLIKKVFSVGISIMFISYTGCGNFCFCQKASAEITQSEQKQFEKLSKATGISSEDMINCLKFSCGDYSCELAIIDGSEEHKKCFIDLFAKEDDEEKNKEKSEYMKYYLNGKLRTKKSVESWYSQSVKRINEPLPSSITLMIKVDDNVVGRIGLGPLSKGNPEIGYVINRQFSSKGITKNAVNASIRFLKLLINSGKYNFKKIRAVAKKENVASNKLLTSQKFIKSEKKSNNINNCRFEYFYHFDEKK